MLVLNFTCYLFFRSAIQSPAKLLATMVVEIIGHSFVFGLYDHLSLNKYPQISSQQVAASLRLSDLMQEINLFGASGATISSPSFQLVTNSLITRQFPSWVCIAFLGLTI